MTEAEQLAALKAARAETAAISLSTLLNSSIQVENPQEQAELDSLAASRAAVAPIPSGNELVRDETLRLIQEAAEKGINYATVLTPTLTRLDKLPITVVWNTNISKIDQASGSIILGLKNWYSQPASLNPMLTSTWFYSLYADSYFQNSSVADKSKQIAEFSSQLWTLYFLNNFNFSDFSTNQGSFFTTFNSVWGQPDKPFSAWTDSDRMQFFKYFALHTFYYNNDWSFFNNSIAKIIEIREEEGRDDFRNALAQLIGKTSHTENYFFLNYNPWSLKDFEYGPRLDFLNVLKNHYPKFKFYVEEIQNKVIEKYWQERTAAEDRKKLITGIVIGVAALLGVITGGLSGALAGGVGQAVEETTGIKVDKETLKSGIESAQNLDLGQTLEGINLNPGELVNRIGRVNLNPGELVNNLSNALKGINLDPSQAAETIKSAISQTGEQNILDSLKNAFFPSEITTNGEAKINANEIIAYIAAAVIGAIIIL